MSISMHCKSLHIHVLGLALTVLGGCGDDATPIPGNTSDVLADTTLADATEPTDTATRPDLGSGDGIGTTDRVATTLLSDGTQRRTVVQAFDSNVWVHLDLPSGAGVTPADPATDTGWTLAVQRYRIRVNGGTSGTRGVTVAWSDAIAWDDAQQAPSGPWVSDDDTKTTPDGETLFAFANEGGWYSYDSVNHVLAARPERVWFLSVPEAGGTTAWFRLRVRDYYDDAGNAGIVTFDWAPVAAPLPTLPEGAFRTTGGPIAFADPTNVDPGTAWDIRLGSGRDLSIMTNGGTSGQGFGAARIAEGSFEDMVSSDTIGFVADRMMPRPGPPGSGELSANPVFGDWYDYNMQTHVVTPKDRVHVVRGHDGAYWKMRVLAFDASGWTLQVAPIARAPKTHEITVVAPSNGDWQRVDLHAGTTFAAGDDASPAWDLELRGVNARTNSGTSGEGQGGAIAIAGSDLDAVVAMPTEGWVVDAMMPIPGPPGSGETSGNAALGTWYDYNMTTHAVTPREVVFALRLRDGTFARAKVVAWERGTWTIAWTSAGPGHTTLF